MIPRSRETFATLLSPHFRLQDLEESSATIFGLWADFSLAYMNPAWEAFATSNDGQPQVATEWGLGASYFNAIAAPLRPFYLQLFHSAPDAGASQHPVGHVYECSSATVYRRFSMQVYALPERNGFVVINSLVVESPHDPGTRVPHNPARSHYENEDGLILQCAHCRLVKAVSDPFRWDWVPAWVDVSPPATSHGLCPLCFEYYYATQPAAVLQESSPPD